MQAAAPLVKICLEGVALTRVHGEARRRDDARAGAQQLQGDLVPCARATAKMGGGGVKELAHGLLLLKLLGAARSSFKCARHSKDKGGGWG